MSYLKDILNVLKSLPRSTIVCLVLLILVIIFAIGRLVLGYTEPNQNPPGGNVVAPLNMGTAQQVKPGDLGTGSQLILRDGINIPNPDYKLLNVGGSMRFNNGADPGITRLVIGQDGNVGIGTMGPAQRLHVAGYVRGDSGLCIGGDCRSSWPVSGVISEIDPTVQGWAKTNNPSIPGSLSANNITAGAQVSGAYFRLPINGHIYLDGGTGHKYITGQSWGGITISANQFGVGAIHLRDTGHVSIGSNFSPPTGALSISPRDNCHLNLGSIDGIPHGICIYARTASVANCMAGSSQIIVTGGMRLCARGY